MAGVEAADGVVVGAGGIGDGGAAGGDTVGGGAVGDATIVAVDRPSFWFSRP